MYFQHTRSQKLIMIKWQPIQGAQCLTDEGSILCFSNISSGYACMEIGWLIHVNAYSHRYDPNLALFSPVLLSRYSNLYIWGGWTLFRVHSKGLVICRGLKKAFQTNNSGYELATRAWYLSPSENGNWSYYTGSITRVNVGMLLLYWYHQCKDTSPGQFDVTYNFAVYTFMYTYYAVCAKGQLVNVPKRSLFPSHQHRSSTWRLRLVCWWYNMETPCYIDRSVSLRQWWRCMRTTWCYLFISSLRPISMHDKCQNKNNEGT